MISGAMTLEASERTKVEGNAVEVKQGRRAGTGTVHGQLKSQSLGALGYLQRHGATSPASIVSGDGYSIFGVQIDFQFTV